MSNKIPTDADARAFEIMRILPTRPDFENRRILVTGATGYIGGHLVPILQKRGYAVSAMVRAESPELRVRWPQADIRVADALNIESLKQALRGIDAAYYLIHSMLLGRKEFETADIRAAMNFRIAAAEAGVKRIIYLGGLGDTRNVLSAHLKSRSDVGVELMKGEVPVTILRAAIIVGAGSASYEMMEHLVENLKVIFYPKWATTHCQPIGIRDVILYLVGSLETAACRGRAFDIGGRDILSYESMMRQLADLTGKKRHFIECPEYPISFFSYIGSLVTPIPHEIIRCLLESTSCEVVCRNSDIRTLIPFEPMSYCEAVVLALASEQKDQVVSRWSDAYPRDHELAPRLRDLGENIRYKAHYSLLTAKPPARLFHAICRIGGKQGWFNNNWLWKLRGGLDRLLFGVGSSRGRRQESALRINDVIDFWRVEALEPDKRLLLRAEMKLPGQGWLEFLLQPAESGLPAPARSATLSVAGGAIATLQAGRTELVVNAYFHTETRAGRLYWRLCLPFHMIVFYDLIQQIEYRS